MKNFFLYFYISLIIVISAGNISAQEKLPDIMWEKIYAGRPWNYINTMIQTADSGFVMACSSTTGNIKAKAGHGGIDIWIVRADASGNILWEKSYGGSRKDQAVRITEGLDGGYIFTGMTYSADGDMPKGKYHGCGDAWVVKLDDTGKIQWQNVLGGSAFDCGNDIIRTPDNCYLMVGTTRSRNGDLAHNSGKADVWMVKMDAKGKVAWNKTCGGSENDIGSGAINISTGGYLVTCSSFSNDGPITGNHGDGDFWLLKIDASGNLVWQKNFGGSRYDFANSIVETGDNGFIACGITTSNDGDITGGDTVNKGNGDFWLLKINENGELLWQRTYGGTGYDQAMTIKQARDNNFVVAGITKSKDGDVTDNHGGIDGCVLKINNAGELIWEKTIGGAGNDSCNYMMNTLDGGYAFCGSNSTQETGTQSKTISSSGWLVKLPPETVFNPPADSALNYKDEIKVFPTLTRGRININLPATLENAEVIVTNMRGLKIDYAGDTKGANRKIILKNCIPGDYVLRVIDKQATESFRIVVVR